MSPRGDSLSSTRGDRHGQRRTKKQSGEEAQERKDQNNRCPKPKGRGGMAATLSGATQPVVMSTFGASDSASHFYFFLPDARFGCHPAAAPLWLGAAIVLIFSFLGFFFSRLLLCSPLAMSVSSG